MVEKRPHPGDHAAPNGVKRARPADPLAAVAAAKAAAAQKAAEIQARAKAAAAARSNGASTPQAPPAAASPAPPTGAAADRLAAMKARMAALKSGAAPAPASASDAPPVRPPADSRAPKFATTLGNRRTDSPLPAAARPQAAAPAQKDDDKAPENPYFDPAAVGTQRTRVARGLLFNQRGKYLDQASKLRQQSRLEEIKQKLAKKNRQAALDENSERGFLVPEPPPCEWWDEGLLDDKTYDCIDDPAKVNIDTQDSAITIYVQHPVLLKAPQDQLLVPVRPIHLTAKESAKLRRMRRAEEHKEEQAKIRLGLVPPPPPKIKRGNMMRVMGEQAIADPTAVEMLVEQQIQDRHNTHVASNEDRKLSKEQRHEKLSANQQKDAAKGLHMCVFKIGSLVSGKHRYQIDINAKQHELTGLLILNPSLNLLIVEGGLHSIQKYKKLMLSRIKWTENNFPTENQAEKMGEEPVWMRPVDEEGRLRDLGENFCTMVFEGEVRERAFRKWGSRRCESDGEARNVLGKMRLDSLWALAKSVE